MQKESLKYVKQYISFENLLKITEKIFLLIKDILEPQKSNLFLSNQRPI